MIQLPDLFEQVIGWLRSTYDEHAFYRERDVVWTVQKRLVREIKERALPFKVFNDYRVVPQIRKSADLVVTSEVGDVEVAAEFKYEPSHYRDDILKNKLPAVFWGAAPSEAKDSVGHDVERAREYVESGKAKMACSIFVDEGAHFRHRRPFPGSRWIDWKVKPSEGHSVSVLWARWPTDS